MDINELNRRINNIHISQNILRAQIDELNIRVEKETNEVQRLKSEVLKTINHQYIK